MKECLVCMRKVALREEVNVLGRRERERIWCILHSVEGRSEFAGEIRERVFSVYAQGGRKKKLV